MTLTLNKPSCQQDSSLVSTIRLIVDNLDRETFSIIKNDSDIQDAEIFLIDDGLNHIQLTINSGEHIELLHQKYDINSCLFEVGFKEINHYIDVLQAFLPDHVWDNVSTYAGDFVQDSSTDNLKLFALVAIAQLL